MATRKLPDYRLKQKILYIDKTSVQSIINYGDSYLEAGALCDASDFYEKASHTAGLQKLKNLALENGDTFLFQRAAKALNLEIRDAEWEDIARRAIQLKKYFFAKFALEKAHNAEALSALKTTMKAEAVE